MAVPIVVWGTTRAMDGHVLTCSTTQTVSPTCANTYQLHIAGLAWEKNPPKKHLYKRICNDLSHFKIWLFEDWIQTHSNKGVDDSQPYGADERGDVGEGQKCQQGHHEEGADQQYDTPQTHKVLQPAHRQASKASSSIRYDSRRHTHPHSYYETSCDSHENQRAGINGASDVARLLLAVAAVLVEEELTGSGTDVCHNYKSASVHHRRGRSVWASVSYASKVINMAVKQSQTCVNPACSVDRRTWRQLRTVIRCYRRTWYWGSGGSISAAGASRPESSTEGGRARQREFCTSNIHP